MTIPNTIARVAPAAFNEGASRTETLAIVRDVAGKPSFRKDADGNWRPAAAFGERLNAVRLEYIAGRVALSLGFKCDTPGLNKARSIIALPGANAKLSPKQKAKRTPEQERAYGAARQWWSITSREAGLVHTDKAKAGNGAKGGKAKNKRQPEPQRKAMTRSDMERALGIMAPPIKPTKESVAQYFRQTSATVLAYVNKYAALATPQLSSAAEDFRNAVILAVGKGE
jgi:hypothetical protein